MQSPFDLIEITVHHINGSSIAHMRPFEFDSDIANYDTMANHFGVAVKPVKCALTCPGCGTYIEVEMECLDELEKKCPECYVPPKLPSILVPFMNPSQTILDVIYTPVINGDINNDDDNLSNLLEALDNG